MKGKFTVLILYFVFSLCFSQENTQKQNNRDLRCEIHVAVSDTGLEGIITRTCFVDSLKFVSVGRPDNKGRYFWDYQGYKLIGKKYVEKKNSELLLDIDILEKTINDEIKKSYESDLKIKELSECMSFIKYRKFTIDEMQIAFDELGNVQFITYYGIPSACLNVDLTIIPMHIQDFLVYVK